MHLLNTNDVKFNLSPKVNDDIIKWSHIIKVIAATPLYKQSGKIMGVIQVKLLFIIWLYSCIYSKKKKKKEIFREKEKKIFLLLIV